MIDISAGTIPNKRGNNRNSNSQNNFNNEKIKIICKKMYRKLPCAICKKDFHWKNIQNQDGTLPNYSNYLEIAQWRLRVIRQMKIFQVFNTNEKNSFNMERATLFMIKIKEILKI